LLDEEEGLGERERERKKWKLQPQTLWGPPNFLSNGHRAKGGRSVRVKIGLKQDGKCYITCVGNLTKVKSH